MKYFIDTEFIEGIQNYGNPFISLWIGKKQPTKPTIDLISIGIVSEDNREYYAISKDFNLKEAWNRFEDSRPEKGLKLYWIRDNVLKPIYKELHDKESLYARQALYRANVYIPEPKFKFTYSNLKKLINRHGKTNKQIAEEVYEFCSNNYHEGNNLRFNQRKEYELYGLFKPEFYGYYSDYDWVVFCWLFGNMISLPKGFPMYCIDLKQTLDKKLKNKILPFMGFSPNPNESLESKISEIKNYYSYPKQTNEHSAIHDARWNYELYKFLNTL